MSLTLEDFPTFIKNSYVYKKLIERNVKKIELNLSILSKFEFIETEEDFKELTKIIYFWKVDYDKISVSYLFYYFNNRNRVTKYLEKFKNNLVDEFKKNLFDPIFFAIANDNYNFIFYLIENRTENQTYIQNNIFLNVCNMGKFDLAKMLLNKTELKINVHSYSNSPFVNLCSNGHIEMAKWLINYPGLNIDIHSGNERAFTQACKNGRLEVAKWLLEPHGNVEIAENYSGTKVDIHTKSLEYPFREACKNGKLKVAKWLVDISFGYSGKKINFNKHLDNLFIDICKENNIEIAKWLLEISESYFGVKVDIHIDNESPFLKMCQHGYLEFAKWLVDIAFDYSGKKIDIHLQNEAAFQIVCQHGYLEFAKWMINISEEYSGKKIDIYAKHKFSCVTNYKHNKNYIELMKWLAETYENFELSEESSSDSD